jgi:hypothetical protein
MTDFMSVILLSEQAACATDDRRKPIFEGDKIFHLPADLSLEAPIDGAKWEALAKAWVRKSFTISHADRSSYIRKNVGM